MSARHAYVHVPFCARRCSYCDFSIAVRKVVPITEFIDHLCAEADRRLSGGGLFDTLYFGGGTPSRLGGQGIRQLIERLKIAGVSLAPDAEVTVEANPDDISPEALESWLKAGVNRLSIGIQSFHQPTLEWMHRTHDSSQAASAVRLARDAGFGNLSIDLIYALPTALGRDWEGDLARAIDLAPDHISAYSLTVEPATPLGKWTVRGEATVRADDEAAAEFLAAHERLGAAGYDHYEVSNYARADRRSRHNSAYWRRVAYLGLGPSAHSYDGADTRRWNVDAYAAWADQLSSGGDPVEGTEKLSADDARTERIYLGLRTTDGLDMADLPAGAATSWVQQGWATVESGVVRLTAEGWLRLDAIVASVTGGTGSGD